MFMVNCSCITPHFRVISGERGMLYERKQFFPNLNIPCMSSRRFSKEQYELSKAWEKTATSEMAKAVEEEKQLAIERGDVDSEGIPLLTVIVDGTWAKRSYRTNYSSLLGAMVVATTCLGINHAIFSVRKFDVCIVDEASQINQIACLGPLFHAKKFILVGDDKQLPPLVTNEKARNKGMEESLFQRLANPENSIELIIQYRMNEEIMRLCNEITYGGILQCGSESIAKSTISLNVTDSLKSQTPAWILDVLNCDLLHSVVFANTDEIVTSSKISLQSQETNEFEANIVTSIVKFLININIERCDIGIISPYRQQVDLIKRKMRELQKSDIEVNTVDQYQGRDKDIIIISCVRCKESSPENKPKGSILNDERRLNVAITRARKKLIIIGCKYSLIHFKPFQNIVACLKNDQILNLNSKDFSL